MDDDEKRGCAVLTAYLQGVLVGFVAAFLSAVIIVGH
jgi:hypothetical protein